ncbi:MAG: DUF1579 domain-containing protein [Armatimonadota bacterium]
MEMPKPQQEHQWLQKFVGEWTVESEGTMGPDQPTMTWKGTESVRSIGGLWILAEGQGEMPEGGTATTIMTLGYDPQKQRFVGTFMGSMMTNLWLYDGTLDADARVLTLDTEGPSMVAEGQMARYQDVIEVISDDHRVLTSRMLGDDGQWHQFMTAHYHRKQ